MGTYDSLPAAVRHGTSACAPVELVKYAAERHDERFALNLLHLVPSIDPAGGGTVTHVRTLPPALERLGHGGEVACLDAPSDQGLAELAAPVHCLGPGLGTYGYTRRLVPWLRANAKRFDAVVVVGIWQYHGPAARAALRGTGVPYVLFTHGMLDPWFRRTYPLKHLKKALYWRLVEHRTLRDAAAVLFTCEEERRLARGAFRPYRCREAVVRFGTASPPEAAEAQRAAFAAAHPGLDGKRLVLYLGRLHPKKGCDLLIRAFAAAATGAPDLHLVLAGPDAAGYRATLEALCRRLGLQDRVSWTGALAGEVKWGAFRAAEVFALPSHSENFGIAVAEALACGRAVLISDKVNIWREIQAAGAGLIGEDTAEGTEDLLRRWLALSEPERRNMGHAARRCFEDTFEITRAARSLVAAIERHISEGRPEPG